MKHKKLIASVLVGASLFLTGCRSNSTFFSDLEKLSNFSGHVTIDATIFNTEFSLVGDIIDFDALVLEGVIVTDNLDANYDITITNGNIYVERTSLLNILKSLKPGSGDIQLLENNTAEYVYTPIPTIFEVGENAMEKTRYRAALRTFVRHLYNELKLILTADNANFLVTMNNHNALLLSRDNLDYLYERVDEFFDSYSSFVEHEIELVSPELTAAQCEQLKNLVLSLKSEHFLDFITKLNEQLSVGDYYICFINTSDMKATPTVEVIFKLKSLTEGEKIYTSIKFISGNPVIRLPDSAEYSSLLHNFIS